MQRVSSVKLRDVAKLTLPWKDDKFDPKQLTQFSKTDTFY